MAVGATVATAISQAKPTIGKAILSNLPPGFTLTRAQHEMVKAVYERKLAEQKKIELARDDFREFIRQAWPTAEPAREFIPNWHIDAIGEHLQAVYEGKIKNLLINVPPGHAKSLIVSVMWPSWVWVKNPKWRGLFASYADVLSIRDSVRCRSLLESPWYKKSFEPKWKLSSDQNLKSQFENTLKGFRLALSVSGKGTGFRGDCIVVDDPMNATDQHSESVRDEVAFWWDIAMSSRLNDLENGSKVIIMQRLHAMDLSGHVLEKGRFEHLRLPSEFEPERRTVTSIGFQDPRTEAGELLFPALFPATVIENAKKDLGSYAFAGQHQQRPSALEGGIFKRHWWHYWRPKYMELPPVQVRVDGNILEIQAVPLPDVFDYQVQSWDCAFKDLETSDYVVGHVWGAVSADRFLLDQKRARLDMPRTVDAIRAMSEKWPKADRKYVEDKANGSAVIQTLQHEIAGFIAVNPEGGKIARAQAVSPQCESGNLYLPHPAVAPWVDGFIEECTDFPNAAHDDQVDAMTQALSKMWKKQIEFCAPVSITMANHFRM